MKRNNMPLTLFGMATRNLVRRPMRTSLTTIGVGVGVVAIVALSSTIQGARGSVDSTIRVNNADLLVFESNVSVDLFSSLAETPTRQALLATPGVLRVVATLWHVVPVEDKPYMLTFGLRLGEMDSARRDMLVRGRIPESEDEVMLGVIAQRALNKDVGDNVAIRGEPFRVVGVFRQGVVILDGAIVVPMRRLQALSGKVDHVTAFQVHLKPGADTDAVIARIEREHPGLTAVTGSGDYSKVDEGLDIAAGMIWVVSLIALIVGAVIVANTMWMSVLERTREIGVLRAVGWSRSAIVRMIVLEAAGLGVAAAIVGCACGVLLAKAAARVSVAEQFLSPRFGPRTFLLAFIVALLLSVLGALAPALRAANVSPAEALRYE